jgi:glycerol-3-phosphate cytidylyltransferase
MQSANQSSKPYKIGFTASAFDLLHAGHIAMLQEAKSICDHLIVGLHVDPSVDRPSKNRPIQSLLERQLQLHAVRYVDQVIVYHTEDELLDILTSVPIDVRIIGEEYRGKHFTGCNVKGIDIHYNRRRHGWSSSSLRWRASGVEPAQEHPAGLE